MNSGFSEAQELVRAGSAAQQQRWLAGLADGSCIGTPNAQKNSIAERLLGLPHG